MQVRQKQKKPIFYKHRPDYVITILVSLLVGFGLILIFSTGWIAVLKETAGESDNNSFFSKQIIGLAVGLLAWVVASKIDYHFWQKHATKIFWGSFAMMFLVLIPAIAVNSGGASRWVRYGFINFQPVEFLKLGAVIFMSAWLTKNKAKLKNPLESLVPFMITIILIVITAIVLQKDMGSAMVIILTLLGIYFVAGVPWWNMTIASSVLLGGGALLVLVAPYRLARLTTFLNSASDKAGDGYHINQALIAFGSGGILGRGVGKSYQAYGYLPQATNDSIFAIIGEEYGLAGAGCVLFIFTYLFWRGVKIAKSAPDDFGRLMAIGISLWIGFQALINVSAMLNLVPLTGITLPFISYGGTSLVALLGGIGILQNISKYTYKEVYDEDSSSRGRDSRTHIAGVGRNRVNTRAQ